MTGPLLLRTHPDTGELLRRRWHLVVLEGQDAGAEVQLDQSPALVGAAPAATLVLGDDAVSRYHAEVDVFAEGLRVRDLDSTNGTFAGDGEARVRELVVEDGGAFRVGRSLIRAFVVEEAAASEIETDPRGVAPGGVERSGELVGASGALREVFRLVRRVAPSSSSVLLEGEPGTGKATLARRLHEESPRRAGPFVELDAGAPDVRELERALFGTAGREGQPGVFERAARGTLHLARVERLPLALQGRLERVLERREVQRLGEDRHRRVDVRVVSSGRPPGEGLAALSRPLLARLSVVRIRVPPLRARPEDAAALADLRLKERWPGLGVGPGLCAALAARPWPGNVPELEAALARLVGEGVRGEPALAAALLGDLLAREAGSVTRAARRLGVSDQALFRDLALARVDLDALA